MTGHDELTAPSAWVERWAALVPPGRVLDLACGGGRHSRFFLSRGYEVVGVDREPVSLPGVRFVRADLEDGSPWPLAGERFDGIVVVNYLHRPLFARLIEALAPGGVLLYATFMAGNERFGKPSNPAFLLRPGELWQAFGGLQVIAFEQGVAREPKPAMRQRLCARQTDKIALT
ncbi:MAG: class I SAM-dependent methyltransferase [Betaproteobacteria bacterium]|nr:class I SAM-dependent methyltransferase [Betaproteobacteria bacterium]MDH5221169.1 class I SAM-dependent methyltransferase [Betaproteobacteria bacterium]